VGEIALLDHRPRTASVVAKTPVTLEVIGQRELAGLLAEVPELSQQLLAAAARRLADLEQKDPASDSWGSRYFRRAPILAPGPHEERCFPRGRRNAPFLVSWGG